MRRSYRLLWILTFVIMTAYCRDPRIDCGPAVEPETLDAPPARLGHSTQRDHRYPKPSSNSHGPRWTDPRRAVVRPGGMNRRHEQGSSPGALASQGLASRMRGPGSDPASVCATMYAVGRDRRLSGHHYDQPLRVRDADNPPQQRPPFLLGRGVMAKYHAGSRRQSPQRRPQSVAHPLVGHQPACGNGVTARHAAAYSARHDI